MALEAESVQLSGGAFVTAVCAASVGISRISEGEWLDVRQGLDGSLDVLR